jgi:excisionase family DNA binding protein
MQGPAATSPSGATYFTSPWLTTEHAADYLSVSVGTLYNWRSKGRGPRYHVVGRIVRYHRDQLDAFLQAGAA